MENSKQHTQLPNKMADCNLTPKDQLVYVVIRSFMNKDTYSCFPSLDTISKKAGISIPTIKKSLAELEKWEYISIKKEGRRNVYYFNKLKEFEPFSPEFIDRTDITPTAKSYLIASQQYMFTDEEGLGKLSYSNRDLSNKINMPESTIRKCNNELKNKNYLTVIKEISKLNKETKIFNLDKLGQAIIWVLGDHETRLSSVEDKLRKAEERINEQSKLIKKLLKDREVDNVSIMI